MRKKALLMVFYVVCWSLLAPAHCYSAESETMVISRQQYNQLVETNNLLIARLETLSTQTKALKTPSAQLIKELESCKSELTGVQKSLDEALTRLTVSQQALKNAQSLLEKAEESLKKLEKQINDEREQAKAVERRLRWQRAIGYVIAGVAIASTI